MARFLISWLLAARFSALELEAHRKWMDEAQERKEDAREALAAKDGRKLLEAAKAIDQLTAREQSFWARTAMRPAKEIAAANRSQALELLRATRVSKMEAAAEAFTRLERTCAS